MRCVLGVQPCGLVALAPFKYPSCLAHPSGPLCFCCCSSSEMNHVLQSQFEQSKIPPYSYCSSKDNGPSDCQLGVPKRPISSQGRGKKTHVSKENTREKKYFMDSVKKFYATGL